MGYTMEGRTYRYYNGDPLYPFGYGLSYTSFKYSDLTVTPTTVTAGHDVTIKVTVQNTGSVDSDEVVQMYMAWPENTLNVTVPHRQLVGFRRELIRAGATATVVHVVRAE